MLECAGQIQGGKARLAPCNGLFIIPEAQMHPQKDTLEYVIHAFFAALA
jgi:hypothetical protein